MAAKLCTGVLSSHLQDIIDIGFGRWAKVDPLLARTACVALQRLSEEDKKLLLLTNGSRLFGILESLVTGFGLPENTWYAAADRAIAALYTIHPTPEILASCMVKKSLKSVFAGCGGDELRNDVDNGSINVATSVQVAKLNRFLFVASHVAMNQLVYIESCVRKVQKGMAKRDKLLAEGQQDHAVDVSFDAHKENSISAELGLAASEDSILDSLSDNAEKEIVSSIASEKNLIGYCAPFISRLCRNISLMQKCPELQASGMLALCRLMIIDANFCEANLQLLFTVVESAPSETVRSNCTVALGDLSVRFPNLLEPWTENMYARLRDPSVSVRKNAVLVLSHLILNDMMKVKGYINEMAICLEDEDERISNLAKLFFHELSKKGTNPIYNLLPDILGKLSSQNLTRDSFCNIMQYLIGSIKKDKQMESLVEKLCHRFTGVIDGKQWEYISYCLSQLAFTEKSMRKLMESLKSYEHVLSNDTVMDHFRSIISKGKKSAKPELKSCIEEFEDKINKLHIEKKEQELTAKNAQAHKEKVESLGTSVIVKKGEECGELDIAEDGEVIDNSTESSQSESTIVDSNANSDHLESEIDEKEVHMPSNNQRGTTLSKGKKSRMKSATDASSHDPSDTTESVFHEDEVQLQTSNQRGTTKTKGKKPSVKRTIVDSNATFHHPSNMGETELGDDEVQSPSNNQGGSTKSKDETSSMKSGAIVDSNESSHHPSDMSDSDLGENEVQLQSRNRRAKGKESSMRSGTIADSDVSSHHSSDMIGSEVGADEVQSQSSNQRGTTKSKGKINSTKRGTVGSRVTTRAISKSTSR